jgi:hypothetical protein
MTGLKQNQKPHREGREGRKGKSKDMERKPTPAVHEIAFTLRLPKTYLILQLPFLGVLCVLCGSGVNFLAVFRS